MISRRLLLSAATAFALNPRVAMAKQEVPSLLDHILLGCNDLDKGIAFVEQRTGVRAAFGGVHPGRGTRNALISLGERSPRERDPRRYLEIIAPDPQQPGARDTYGLQGLSEPRLVTWAAHPGNIQALADRLAKQGIAADGPTSGSRKRPDGQLLEWKALSLRDNASGLLPFFIEWSANSPHPSTDAPRGCHLSSFEVLTPNPETLAKAAMQLGLDLAISRSATPQLRAAITCAGGELILTS
jgi:hypothetical protein